MMTRISAASLHRRNSGEHRDRARIAIQALLGAGILFVTALPATSPAHGNPPGAAPNGKSASPAQAAEKAPESAPSSEPPILEGILEPMQIIEVSPEWRANLVSYAPDPDAVERIRAITSKRRSELKIEAVLGTWCGDSRREVPHFIKIQQILDVDRIPVVFMGVDRSKLHPAEVAEGRDIQRVPTFIVYHDGKEIGRIIETPKRSIEADLAEILAGLGAR